ncbi:MAG TPA: AAA family ATPase, partial [Gaiellaceae bacterium]|nr:AAA family ATPase [Gaiellaceae bacterium]
FITDPARVALLVEGEPGIGKTTLWLHAARAAELRGHRVLRAEPAEREAKLSYAALTDLIGPVYDVGRGELPEPQQRALDAALLRSAGSANARTIGSALVNFLGALARTDPVVLAIDDAQWLDRASTAGLEFAARRLPTGVKLLLARRPGAEAPLGLDRDSVTRIEVGPLSLGGIHHLLRTHLGSPPPRPTLARIAQTSGGNPFFALELARAPAGHAPGVPLTVPESLQELVAGRIEALSSAAREAVLLASAFTRPTVEAVAAPPAALQEAEAAGVLVVERGRIRFSHPLLSAAVYGAAGGAERLELHRRLADLVEDPDERALHLSLSVSSPDEPAAAEIEAAAARAARRGAQDAAAELYRAAHDLTPDVDGAARARRLSGEAAALHAAGSPAQARAAAERAVEAAPHGPARAEALFFLSPIAWIDPGELGPLDCLHLALAEPGLDPRLRGRIHSKLGMYSDGDQRQGVEHAEAAASLLQAELDPGLLAYTLLAVLFFGAQTGRGIHEGLLKRALELEQRAGRESEKSSLVLIWLQCTDAHEGARARHRLEDEWYRDRGEEIWRAEKRSHLALVEFQAGNWALARRLVEQSCAELEPVGSQGPLGMPFWTRARFDVYTGRIEEARATLLPMLADARARPGNAWFTTFLLEVLGFAALTEGDCDAADRAFAELEELLASIGVTVPFAVRPDADHVEAVVGLGEIERARRLLVRFEERHASAPRPWTLQALPRAQALVAAAEGDPTRALSILEQAPVVAELPFEHARNLLVQGSLQRRLKRKRAAAESLGRAFETFTGLGSPDWARRARDELDRVGLRRGDPYELTETERRVAELAASGMTNREVAQAAFVSPKTVEANLARVYRKLGIRSRAELGASMSARQP